MGSSYARAMRGLQAMAAERPWLVWSAEKFGTSLVIFFVLYCLRSCWRTARANQKLALGDAADYMASERRGLLLPLKDPHCR